MEDIIFIKPSRFEDIIKYMEYIDKEVVVHINIHDLDKNAAQRVVDFITGAVYIKEGSIINPGEKIYCVIPKDKKFVMQYKNNSESNLGLKQDEVEEIIRK
ncbi:MAG: cell division protein SepF [Fusobacteriaceae bacterium]